MMPHMTLRSLPKTTFLVVVFALLACKLFKKEEPAPSASAPAEPPPTPTAEAPEAAAPATSDTSAAPTPTSIVTVHKGDAGVKDASAATDSGSGAKSAACQTKCNGALQACLVPAKKEGGLPTLADPTKCQTAFNDCLSACK